MLSLLLGFTILVFAAVAFMAWPLWRYRQSANPSVDNSETKARLAENVRLFRVHLAELERSLASQTIGEEQFLQLKLELERNLLDDEANFRSVGHTASSFFGIKSVAVFSFVILCAGVLLYYKLGSAEDVSVQILQQQKMQQDYQDMQQNRNPDQVLAKALIAEYRSRLAVKPDNVQYWFLLARSEMEVSNFAEAATAYQRVLDLDPQSPMIMAELAQAMFLRDGNKMSSSIADLAKSTLTLDPKNTLALGLAGINAFNSKSYREAIGFWQRTVDLVGADSAGGQALVAGIDRAKQQFIIEGGKFEDLTAKSTYAVTVFVSLGDKVKASPDQVVFVYARAWKGTPMPLAIMRLKVSDLPKLVTLDETMAMSPMATLANTADIEVLARVSADGSAQTKVGDWQAKLGPISMASVPEKIELLINEQVSAENTKP